MLIDYSQLQLPVARLRFVFTAITPLFLPEYTGSTFRGSFGTAFKKICCAAPQRPACPGCPFLGDCAYAYIFETPQTGQSALQATNLPHPFVFEPPLSQERSTIEAGEQLQCGMVLVGRAIEHLFHFVLVWHEMGRQGIGKQRGRFTLDAVYNERNECIYQTTTGILKNNLWVRQPLDFVDDTAPSGCTLEIHTPLRITEMGKLCRDVSFSLFWRNLLRRASLLASVHTPQTWELDYTAIISESEKISVTRRNLRWWDWERYSNRQQRRMQLGGMVGKMKLTGDLALFWPLLCFGQYIHVGKNTTFGMGNYTLQSLFSEEH